jgi:hypothetical protein
VNSGHVAFQWTTNDVVYGFSVHGIMAANRAIVRGLFGWLELVSPSRG